MAWNTMLGNKQWLIGQIQNLINQTAFSFLSQIFNFVFTDQQNLLELFILMELCLP